MLFHAILADGATGEARPAAGSPTPHGSYVMQVAWTIAGAIDVDALQRAWQTVASRHSTLRTAFVWDRPEGPIQIVWKRVPIKIDRIDLRDLPKEEQDTRIALRAAEDARSFDMRKA